MIQDIFLLELAAKSMGYKYSDVIFEKDTGLRILSPVQRVNWNPLVSDSDAFQMAVRLRMSVNVFDNAIGIGTQKEGYLEYKWSGDECAATRRAITCHAAEIGRRIK